MMLAVVMAGGKGSRLRPLTCEKPKPMVPVANRPLLEHVLRLLAGQGWDEIALTLCYQPEKIQAYFGDGRSLGAQLRYFVEERPLGTAGSVKMAEDLFTETFLVASGDALSDFDLRPALAFHRERGALVTIVLARVASPLEYGIVVTEPDGRVVRFLEKPGWGEVFSDTVNTGFYLVEPETFALVPAGQAFDFSRDLFPTLLARGAKLYGYVAEGYWSDIGTIEQYRRAHEVILAGKVGLAPAAGEERAPGVWVGPGTEIEPGAVLEGPAFLGSFCRIERGAAIGPYTVIGDHGFVAEGAAVRRSILWRHVYLGPRAEVDGAVIGDQGLVRNDAAVQEGAVVGDGALVGAHSIVRPRARIWPGRHLASGSLVRGSVVADGGMVRGLFGAAGVSGVANLELTPENAVRLGAAFATTLGVGRKVAIASDGFPVSRLLKRALACGLLGAGVGVSDLGALTAPAARYAIGLLGLAGGIYLGLSDRERHRAVVQFFEARGLPLSRQEERGLEQAYFGEDFIRVDAARVGELAYVPGMAESYLDAVAALVDVAAVRAAGFTLVLTPMNGPPAALLPGLLTRFGCRWIPLGGTEGMAALPRDREAIFRSGEEMERLLAGEGGGIGIGVDPFGEELFVFAKGLGWLDQTRLAALLALAELRGSGRRLAIPVTAPEAIVELARAYRGQVVRTKNHRRFLFEEYAAEAPALGGLLLPVCDALVALARLLEFMAVEERDLPALLGLLPSYERVERAVACAWEEKGQLMRRLFEESRHRRLDLTDGLRVREEEGWALVLPDGEEPFIRVFSEAGTLEEAEAINRLYLEKLTALRAEGRT